jgi:hypothetical protein
MSFFRIPIAVHHNGPIGAATWLSHPFPGQCAAENQQLTTAWNLKTTTFHIQVGSKPMI